MIFDKMFNIQYVADRNIENSIFWKNIQYIKYLDENNIADRTYIGLHSILSELFQ